MFFQALCRHLHFQTTLLFHRCASCYKSFLTDTLYQAVLENNIVLDMSELVELDNSGIGFLMAAFNDSVEAGNKLYFLSMSNEADKAITATGFKQLFNLINSVTEVA